MVHECEDTSSLIPTRLPPMIETLDAECLRREVEIDGSRIVARQWGSGMPLILLHGGHGSWLHWHRNIRALAQHHTLCLIDLPGFGDSDLRDFDDMANYSAPVARAIEVLFPQGRFAFGGFSFGSIVAAFTLPFLSRRIERLIMVGSPVLTSQADFVRDRMVQWRNITDPAMLLQAHAANLQVLMLGPDTRATDEAALIQHAMTSKARLRYKPGKSGVPARRIIREHRPRLVAIWGEQDVLVCKHFLSASALIQELDNGSKMHIIPGAGHWVQFEQDEAVSNLILQSLHHRSRNPATTLNTP